MNKKNGDLKRRISVTMSPKTLEELDKVSKEKGISRSALLGLAWQAYSGQGSLEDAVMAAVKK